MTCRYIRVFGVLLAMLVVVAGCGDEDAATGSGSSGAGASGGGETGGSGGGGGEGGLGPDPSPAEVTLTFPLGVGSTTEEHLVVRGTVTDPEGVASVSVNGADAVVDGEAWTADVALAWGVQPIEVTVVDGAGYTSTSEQGLLERAALLSLIRGGTNFDFDDEGNLYVLSGTLLMGVRPNGERFGVAEVPERETWAPIAHVPATDSLLVATAGELASYSVADGTRTVIATSAGGPAETSFEIPGGLVYDAATNRAVLIDNDLGQLVAVDLDTGEKSVFVPWHLAVFDQVIAFAHDEVNGRILVIDRMQASPNAQVLAYALSDGDRDVISFSGPDEIDLGQGWGLATDGTSAWAVTGWNAIAIDLDSGARSLAFTSTGTSAELDMIGYDGTQLLVGSAIERAVYVRSTTGSAPTLLANNRFPAGAPEVFESYANGRAGAAPGPDGVVYTGASPVAVDLSTGAREPLPGGRSLYGHIYDETTGALYGYDFTGFFTGEVLTMKPATDSEWTVLASVGRAVALVHDAPRNRLLVADETTITAVDLGGGGSGTVFGTWNELRGAVLAPDGATLYVLESEPTAFDDRPTLYGIDLDTGVREKVAEVTNWSFSDNDQRVFDLFIEGDLVVVPHWSDFTGTTDAFDVVAGTQTDWDGIPEGHQCWRTAVRFLSDELLSYGGRCLLDRTTGAQVAVAR